MEAAFRLLEENPCNDEAVFAALALVSKVSDFHEMEQRKLDLWKAIDGKVFFERLLATKHMETIALNFLTIFCRNEQCAVDIRQSFGEELIQTCMDLLLLHNNSASAVRDGIECCSGLGNCSGTTVFMLDVISSTAMDKDTKQAALEAFANTKDPFLFSEDVDRAVDLLSTECFAQIALGIATRLEQDVPLVCSADTQMKLFNTLHIRIRAKNMSAEQRRALLVLSSSALLFLKPQRDKLPSGYLFGVSVLASIELQVGLSRISSALLDDKSDLSWKRDEMPAVLASSEILDRVRCWLMVADEEDDAGDSVLIRSLMSGLDAACMFVKQQHDIEALLMDSLSQLVCGIVYMFWREDPNSQIVISSQHLPAAMFAMSKHDLLGMLPMLARLDAGLLGRFLEPLAAQVDELFARLAKGNHGNHMLCLCGELLLLLDRPCEDFAFTPPTPITEKGLLEECCFQGIVIAINMLANKSIDKAKVTEFLSESDLILNFDDDNDDEVDLSCKDWPQQVQRFDLKRIRQVVVLEK